MPNLRDSLLEICTNWTEQRVLPFKGNALAEFIRKDLSESIRSILPEAMSHMLVKASAGAGVWAGIPWLSVIHPDITRSTTDGFYVVYLFRGDGSGVYLSLNQGITGPSNRLGQKKAREAVERVKSVFRSAIPALSSWEETIALASQTQLGASYEPTNIGAKFYPVDSMPSNEVLVADLMKVLSIANEAIPVWNAIHQGDRQKSMDTALIDVEVKITKPFLILAGISGTGKTRWVKTMASRTRGDLEDDNLCLIPVRPDWHEPSDLLGYVSRVSGAKFVGTDFLDFLIRSWIDAWEASPTLETPNAAIAGMTPYWLALDEMNLAPVEQYFADYLSVLELRSWDGGVYKCPPLLKFGENADLVKEAYPGTPEDLWSAFVGINGIPLPPNLIVVGTVNMDETTHAFSRKVLDRAMTIEFDDIDLSRVFSAASEETAPLGPNAVLCPFTNANDLQVSAGIRSGVLDFLGNWNAVMADSPFRVAYRTANEGLILAHFKGEENLRKALDEILMMKLLPRLEGDVEKLGCDERPQTSAPDDSAFPQGLGNTLLKSVWDLAKQALGVHWDDSKSKRKILYMAKRLSRSGYTSFWP